jgi:hypothetical protein
VITGYPDYPAMDCGEAVDRRHAGACAMISLTLCHGALSLMRNPMSEN